METSEIKKKIDRIPSQGGRQLGEDFDKYVSLMDNGLSIVEMGAWLGAGTAQIAYSMQKYGKDKSTLYCIDSFLVHGRELEKAKNQGLMVKHHQDTLSIVKNYLSELSENVNIEFHKMNVMTYKHTGEKIGVYVLDCAKKDPTFTTLITKMEKYFIPGKTIVFFMDYYYYKKTKSDSNKAQERYVKKSHKYTLLKGQESKVIGEFFPSLSCAIMRYEG